MVISSLPAVNVLNELQPLYQVSSTSLDHGSKLRGSSPKALVQLNSATLIFTHSLTHSAPLHDGASLAPRLEPTNRQKQHQPRVHNDDHMDVAAFFAQVNYTLKEIFCIQT
ncbi:hypothetical protein TNCV_1141151 [Trichonephila clavipes]|nr:hypothetical protein TNCV_1141151 [Trichonephila clavipes]